MLRIDLRTRQKGFDAVQIRMVCASDDTGVSGVMAEERGEITRRERRRERREREQHERPCTKVPEHDGESGVP